MRLRRDPVKHSSDARKNGAFWGRWLEGWELIIPSVGVAALATSLALPQPTLPEYLPLPTLDPAALARARGLLLAQAIAVRQQPLSFEVRSIGERFRQFGRATGSGQALSFDERKRYRNQIASVLSSEGSSSLLQLRAIQTELFVEALRQFEKTQVIGTDLTELGGDFLSAADKQHLSKPRTSRRTRTVIELNDDERRAMFLLRWTELAGLSEVPAFRPDPTWTIVAARPRLRLSASLLDEGELSLIDRLSAVSVDYPAPVAKGLILAHHGAYAAAAGQFRDYLRTHPDAAFSRRARCHLAYVGQFSDP
jgi:hypothetical protein